MPWRRKWQPTPVLLLGKSHGQRSLVGYSPWGRKELDTTEWLHFSGYRMISHFGFDLYISLMISDIEHLFIYILAICTPSGEISVQILCPFKIEFLSFYYWVVSFHYYLVVLFYWSIYLVCNIVLVSGIWQSNSVIYFFRLFSIVVYYKILNIVPCVNACCTSVIEFVSIVSLLGPYRKHTFQTFFSHSMYCHFTVLIVSFGAQNFKFW